MWKMSSPSSMRRRDLNPRTREHQSSPITTRPGLPPIIGSNLAMSVCWGIKKVLQSRLQINQQLLTYLHDGTIETLRRKWLMKVSKCHLDGLSQADDVVAQYNPTVFSIRKFLTVTAADWWQLLIKCAKTILLESKWQLCQLCHNCFCNTNYGRMLCHRG